MLSQALDSAPVSSQAHALQADVPVLLEEKKPVVHAPQVPTIEPASRLILLHVLLQVVPK